MLIEAGDTLPLCLQMPCKSQQQGLAMGPYHIMLIIIHVHMIWQSWWFLLRKGACASMVGSKHRVPISAWWLQPQKNLYSHFGMGSKTYNTK